MQNYPNWTISKGAREASKFYYITRLRDIGENSKIDSFQDFHFKLLFYFHNQKLS